ncbi:MAG: hypothetical protein ACFFAZ_03485 [Promethearchaeota archaeon]
MTGKMHHNSFRSTFQTQVDAIATTKGLMLEKRYSFDGAPCMKEVE